MPIVYFCHIFAQKNQKIFEIMRQSPAICDISLADFEDILDYAEEHGIKLYNARKIKNNIQEASKLWAKMSEDNLIYM